MTTDEEKRKRREVLGEMVAAVGCGIVGGCLLGLLAYLVAAALH